MNERIKKLRKALDLTQQAFADRLGIRQNTIAKYETNRGTPTTSVISLIVREFNVSEKWLRTGEGEMFVEAPSNALDALAKEYGLDRFGRAVIEKMVNLNEKQWELLSDMVTDIVSKLSENAAPAFAPAHIPTIEEEARAEAKRQTEEIYKQILAEKKAAAGMSLESSEPKAGDGMAKQA